MTSPTGYQNILLVTDGQTDPKSTAATATWLTTKHGASLTVMDTIPRRNGIQSWLSGVSAAEYEQQHAGKLHRLEGLAEQFRDEGIQASFNLGVGPSSSAIIEHVIENSIDLVIRYRKGCYSQAEGLFGNTARRLARHCPCPLLFTGSRPIKNPKVLACVDLEHDTPENGSIILEAARMATRQDHLWGISCWEVYLEGLVEDHMNQDQFNETLSVNEKHQQQRLDKFAETIDISMIGNGIALKHGRPADKVPEFCDEQGIDVVTLCSATLNHPLKRFLGSTAETLLTNLNQAILLVKPLGSSANEHQRELNSELASTAT